MRADSMLESGYANSSTCLLLHEFYDAIAECCTRSREASGYVTIHNSEERIQVFLSNTLSQPSQLFTVNPAVQNWFYCCKSLTLKSSNRNLELHWETGKIVTKYNTPHTLLCECSVRLRFTGMLSFKVFLPSWCHLAPSSCKRDSDYRVAAEWTWHLVLEPCCNLIFFFIGSCSPLQSSDLLFSSVIILHTRKDSLDEWSASRKAAT
jgi:hypothetical protein